MSCDQFPARTPIYIPDFLFEGRVEDNIVVFRMRKVRFFYVGKKTRFGVVL